MTLDLFNLSGKVALVTAAGAGLGSEFCIGLAAYGADLIVNDLDLARAEETAVLAREYGARAVALAADVSNPSQVEGLVKDAKDSFGGRIDILFANAATRRTPPVRLHEYSLEAWDHTIAANLTSAFLCMRAILPLMIEQKGGSIVLTSSVGAIKAGTAAYSVPHLTAYGATKAALLGMMRHACVAYAPDNIRINAIAPGGHAVKPPGMSEADWDRRMEVAAGLMKGIPMGRLGRPEEIRGLAVYLASDASSYVTGQVFVEDGGFTA